MDNHSDQWDWFFQQLRRWPAMFLGKKSVIELAAFVYGIETAERIHKVAEEKRFPGFSMDVFEEWAAIRFYNGSRACRSFYVAGSLAGDERGLDLWFEWVDEFLHGGALNEAGSPKR
jgi:hypothetical protein